MVRSWFPFTIPFISLGELSVCIKYTKIATPTLNNIINAKTTIIKKVTFAIALFDSIKLALGVELVPKPSP
jgi:hypothetical protein